MKETGKGYLAIILQSMIIGLSYMFVKLALKSVSPIELLAHRFTVAAIMVMLIRGMMPNRMRVQLSDLKKLMPLSIAYPMLFFLFQTLGLRQVTSTQAGIIYALIPIMTLLGAHFVLGEPIGRSRSALMLVSVSGVVFINLMSGFKAGDFAFASFLLIFLSAVSASVYNVLTRKLTQKYSTFDITYVMTMLSFITFNLISVIQHVMAGTILQYFEPFRQISFVLPILYLGILSSLMTSFLTTFALGRLEASTVGQFNNLGTVISILAGVIFLKESLFAYHFIGIVAILAGTIGFNYVSQHTKKEL